MDSADLNNVVEIQLAFLAGVDTGPVDEGAVGTVQVLDGKDTLGVVPVHDGMLARAPHAIGRFLILQVDIDRFIIGPADRVVPMLIIGPADHKGRHYKLTVCGGMRR